MPNAIYPLTIILDRYNGIYSGGKFTAWNKDFDQIDERVNGDDVSCNDFFSDNDEYGRGDTIEEAISDLSRKLNH